MSESIMLKKFLNTIDAIICQTTKTKPKQNLVDAKH